MRSLIFQAIISDATLNGFGIVSANSFAVDVDTPLLRPFLQLRWGTNVVGLRQTAVTRRTLAIWVHDEPGDYSVKIDPIILRLRDLLPSLEGSNNGAGYLVSAEWLGDSEDLSDDGHGTITRNASFSLVGSGQ
jgi:hypothetical protein